VNSATNAVTAGLNAGFGAGAASGVSVPYGIRNSRMNAMSMQAQAPDPETSSYQSMGSFIDQPAGGVPQEGLHPAPKALPVCPP
jgi:hypothetical protein